MQALLSSLQIDGFRGKKNLTEINHKVSVAAKWFVSQFDAAFASKCAATRKTPVNSRTHRRERVMQESLVGTWTQEKQLSGAMLHSLRDLNRRFLELAATARGEGACRGGLSTGILVRLAPLSRPQREAAADCPYALFDLRFRDAAHWQYRLQNAPHWRVADEPGEDEATVEFVRLALFYAWHIASMAGITAQLLLGMNGATADAFRAATVDTLPSLAVSEAAHLTARWSDCSVYWSALFGAASDGNPAMLRRVQLHGLQLAAASRLPYADARQPV
jgi:hypothetical protein